jgi:hypothetical protein
MTFSCCIPIGSDEESQPLLAAQEDTATPSLCDQFGIPLKSPEQRIENDIKASSRFHDILHGMLACIGGSTAIKGAIITTQGVFNSSAVGLTEAQSAPYDLTVAALALGMATIVNFNSSPDSNTIASMKAGMGPNSEGFLKFSGAMSGLASGALAFGAPYALAKIFNHVWPSLFSLPAQFGPVMVTLGLLLAAVNTYTSYQVGMTGPLNIVSTGRKIKQDWQDSPMTTLFAILFSVYGSFFPLLPYSDGISGFLAGFMGNKTTSSPAEWTNTQTYGYWGFFSVFSIFNVVSLSPYMFGPAYDAGHSFFSAITQCCTKLEKNPDISALLEHESERGLRYYACHALIIIAVIIMALCYWVVFAGYTVSTLDFYGKMNKIAALLIGATSVTATWGVALVKQMHNLLYSKVYSGDDNSRDVLIRHYVNILRLHNATYHKVTLEAHKAPVLKFKHEKRKLNFDHYIFYHQQEKIFKIMQQYPDDTISDELKFYKLSRDDLIEIAYGILKIDGMKDLLKRGKVGMATTEQTIAIRLPGEAYLVDVKFTFDYSHREGMHITMALNNGGAAAATAINLFDTEQEIEPSAGIITSLNCADKIDYSDASSA